MFDPNSSLLAGTLSRDQLIEALTTAQQAYLELLSGDKGVSFSYSQGDGTRSVTFQKTEIQHLVSLIQGLQAQLGIVTRPRRTLRFRW
ncbi:TPA: gpW family head-tail joining protein [Raoultella planticola]|uniref:gpW family head-tail joining protein n=1 Tax=Raoultella planticola TaxID=575 RepID=UPI000C1B0871|nr:gpW family head-tail joining protein [Raoultella planticola]ELT9609924.1 phage head-tail adapter protein [Raoultella planticola]ELU0689040.1 phage head-tail adapter protein [Raoultella planticola]PIM81948.1 phage head-tail adapter protein [Raoultella planticola]HAT1631594.1 phage head-tail adapter protein [Raoultella planticola]